jgi:hypothetical protein
LAERQEAAMVKLDGKVAAITVLIRASAEVVG